MVDSTEQCAKGNARADRREAVAGYGRPPGAGRSST